MTDNHTTSHMKPRKRLRPLALVLGGLVLAATLGVACASEVVEPPDTTAQAAQGPRDYRDKRAESATTERSTTTRPPTTTTTVPPTTTTTVPPTTTTTAPPEDPQVTNARRSAQSYLDIMGFSRQGLIDQLSSEYGDQYPVEVATAAVDSLNVDWNAEAVEKAQSYLEMMGFSHAGLVDQLSSEYGDQFTREQAEHGATVALGA